MIKELTKQFQDNKHKLRAKYEKERPSGYEDIVKDVIKIIGKTDNYYKAPDPERITKIDEGDYQGTLVFVISCQGYQPHEYYYLRMWYGSCSGCDAFLSTQGWGDEITEDEVDGYMTMALHTAQRLKKMDEDSVV
jgi:hypothetical protein